MSEELNKLDLFIKVMKMTTAEDGPALIAIRKANAMLKAEGWDWDRLLRGKVKIIQDPFGAVSAPAPTAKPAFRSTPQPPPPPTPAPDPFAGMGKPQPPPPKEGDIRINASTGVKEVFKSGYWQTWRAPAPPPPKQAPAGPLHFRRASNGEWAIASYMRLDNATIGQQVTVERRDGSKPVETVGPFIEQEANGYYLYKIAKASKYRRRHADQTSVNDVI